MRLPVRVSCLATIFLLSACRTEIAEPELGSGARPISQELRASCPADASGRRSAEDAEVVSNPTFVFVSSIHDTTGKLVRTSVDTGIVDTAAFRKGLLFPAGVATGKHFLFYQIRDTTKAVLREDSLCFFVKD